MGTNFLSEELMHENLSSQVNRTEITVSIVLLLKKVLLLFRALSDILVSSEILSKIS